MVMINQSITFSSLHTQLGDWGKRSPDMEAVVAEVGKVHALILITPSLLRISNDLPLPC